MSIASVVTRGYGTPGSAALVVTRGYSVSAITAPTVPGLEFTLGIDRLHYTLDEQRLHFTLRDEDT